MALSVSARSGTNNRTRAPKFWVDRTRCALVGPSSTRRESERGQNGEFLESFATNQGTSDGNPAPGAVPRHRLGAESRRVSWRDRGGRRAHRTPLATVVSRVLGGARWLAALLRGCNPARHREPRQAHVRRHGACRLRGRGNAGPALGATVARRSARRSCRSASTCRARRCSPSIQR